MYFPVALLSIVFASLIVEFFKEHTVVKVVLFVLIISSGILCYQRTLVWKDSETIWSDTVQKNPESRTALNNLALTYREANNYKMAVSTLEQAARVTTDDVTPPFQIYFNLAQLYANRQHIETHYPKKALFYLNKSREYASNEPQLKQILQLQNSLDAN